MRKSAFLGSIKDKFRGDSDRNSEKSESKKALAPNNPFADPDDAPPAYSETAPPVASSSKAPPPQITREDDEYAFLASFDTIFLIDDSGSMEGANWREVSEVLLKITEICTARDEDGIDLYFLNHRSTEYTTDAGKPTGGYYGIDTPQKVHTAFQRAFPNGGTPTGKRLQEILDPYVARLAASNNLHEHMEEVKPINIIVITDGSPSDDPERIILHYARKLDMFNAPSHQVGIQFFQIGNDRRASAALKELDDELVKQKVRDMVDTVTWDGKSSNSSKNLTADGILKVVLGAVVRRWDRKDLGQTW
ncbi:hypothetical protein MKX08_004850 [Trichoderma sp. CBMAI-0020]|nr:hypothetical protein MKX08_004850 [Trichoderma sp. CBMAI-0020]